MDGYIAFLDLLGFSRFVARDTFDETVDAYFTIVEESIGGPPPHAVFTIASDSTILTTEGATLSDLRALLESVSRITYRSLMELDLPIRGGITFGHFRRMTRGEAGMLVAGRGVIAAYELEQAQDWIGVTLAPALIERHPELQDYFDITPFRTEEFANDRRRAGHANWSLLAIWHGEIPLQRDDDRLTGYVVVPRTGRPISDGAGVLRELGEFQDKLEELTPRAPDVRAQRKYGKAGLFIHRIRREWGNFSQSNAQFFAQFTRDL